MQPARMGKGRTKSISQDETSRDQNVLTEHLISVDRVIAAGIAQRVGWICNSRTYRSYGRRRAERATWKCYVSIRFQPKLHSFQAEKYKKRRERRPGRREESRAGKRFLHAFLLHSTSRTLTCGQAFYVYQQDLRSGCLLKITLQSVIIFPYNVSGCKQYVISVVTSMRQRNVPGCYSFIAREPGNHEKSEQYSFSH